MGNPIPVTVITGYLGSGKTTLLERIINDSVSSGRRIAIVMNEFGRISIDAKVIEGRGIRIAELSGGCVCCSLSGEFASAVDELIRLAGPEWIVVETTGVAEPSALAYDIENNIKSLRLESIVTVVDADAVSRYPAIGHTGVEQIGLADLLIMNKCDLVEKETERSSVRSAIKNINPRAKIVDAINCEIDMGLVFEKSAGQPESAPGLAAGGSEREHETEMGGHEIDVDCFEYSSERVMDHGKIIALIRNLPKEAYRAKGFIITQEGSFLVDHVAGRTSMKEFKNDKTELVFIGEGIGDIEKDIRKGLDGCLARP